MRLKDCLFPLCAALLSLVACGPAGPEVVSPPPGTAAPAVTSAPAAGGTSTASASTSPAGPTGLDAPDNDPDLVATARAALPCFRAAECPARDKWYEPFNRDRQVDPKTLVNFLEDARSEVRGMAASVLRGKKGKPGFHTDAALAKRVLDALEREKDEQVARDIALAAGYIDAKATGLQDRLLKFLKSEPREQVRAELAGTLVHGNWDNPEIVEAVKKLIDDPSEKVRREALRSLDVPELRAQACAFWLANVGHKEASTGDRCAFHIVYHGCGSSYEGLMDALGKRAPQSPENLQSICMGGSPDSVKKKLISLTEKWAKDGSLTGSVRVQALRVLGQCDPALGKKTASGLLKDSDEYVREKAAEAQKAPAP